MPSRRSSFCMSAWTTGGGLRRCWSLAGSRCCTVDQAEEARMRPLPRGLECAAKNPGRQNIPEREILLHVGEASLEVWQHGSRELVDEHGAVALHHASRFAQDVTPGLMRNGAVWNP